ncbi:MAG: hypothetical protein HY286_04610 [Planctomycetes bacterium]|nr:hypothetical protein [Planctomycetota bacterium]
MITHPALALLTKRKLRGAFRKQIRRTKTAKGAAFAIIGLLVILLWYGSVILGQSFSRNYGSAPAPVDPQRAVLMAQFGFFSLLFINLISSLGHRGLYIPKDEIEVLFSAPVSRSAIIRYRLTINILKSMFGALLLSFFAMRRVPVPIFGFFGTFVAIQTLPIYGQLLSLLSGNAENKFFDRIPKGAVRAFTTIAVVAVIAAFALLFMPGRDFWDKIAQRITNEGGTGILQNQIVSYIMAPARPWAGMATAASAPEFFKWFSVSIGIWMLLFFVASRIPVDYRELSLETSADVAKRLQRVRRGGGGSGVFKLSPRVVGWRAPWIFGRGVFGALAWRKSMSMLRKARVALMVSITIIALCSIGVSFMILNRSPERMEPWFSGLASLLGCIYLSNFLRFDFREDLDKIDILKTYPAACWKIFVATLIPQTTLVTALLYGMLIIKGVITRTFHPAIPLFAAAIPIFTFIWIAVDNVIYLFAPTRAVAGQDTMLQNAGRAFVLLLLRMFILSITFAGAAIPVGIAVLIINIFAGIPESAGQLLYGAGFLVGLAFALLEAAVLAWAGGLALRRFDVASDRP